jgi:hypothetical protein
MTQSNRLSIDEKHESKKIINEFGQSRMTSNLGLLPFKSSRIAMNGIGLASSIISTPLKHILENKVTRFE